MGESSVLKTLKELIKIKSYVSDSNNEAKLGDYIYDYLTKNTNLTVEKQNVEKNRFNIIAYKTKKPKIILFGHMDTIPPKVESKEPFTAREDSGKLYGLGSVDMKAGLAVMLEIAAKYNTDEEIAYIFTVDEEYEFKGAKKLIEEYTLEPEYIVNLEPTDLKIYNGCRGVAEFSFNVHGESCHASKKDEGINAIEKTFELYDILQQEITKLNSKDLKNTLNLAYTNGGILDENNNVVSNANVIPNFCKSVGEIRVASPEIDETYLKDKIFGISSNLGVEISDYNLRFLLGSMYTDKTALKSFEEAVRDSDLKIEYGDVANSGYFEVQQLQGKWGGNVVIFGPGPSSNAHKVNEYVDLNTLYKTVEVIESFVKLCLK